MRRSSVKGACLRCDKPYCNIRTHTTRHYLHANQFRAASTGSAVSVSLPPGRPSAAAPSFAVSFSRVRSEEIQHDSADHRGLRRARLHAEQLEDTDEARKHKRAKLLNEDNRPWDALIAFERERIRRWGRGCGCESRSGCSATSSALLVCRPASQV